MRPESLDFGVKRFCGCIGQPVLEVVDNGVIVVFKGFNDLAESVVSECFHAVVPSGEVKPCRGRGGLPVENVHKFKVEVVRPLQHGEHPEQHAGPFPLLRVPFGFVGEKQVFAARHDLRPGLAVLHPFRLPFPDKVLLPPRARGPAPGPEFLDGLVLLGEHLPAEVYPHVVDGAVSIMADDRSVVTVFTLRRTSSGTSLSMADTVSEATPRTIAASVPFLPRPALLVRTV